MAGPSWIVDGKRFATKIKSACDPLRVAWKSNPTKACPNCHHAIDNSDVAQYWPGLPRGVKFDPTDQEIIWHLLEKVGSEGLQPHPFINEFIPTVENDEGICYTHPQNLPGVKQDGSVSHFYHRAIKAYNTGTRKRRKILGDDSGDVRWHKTGRTKPVILDGVQKGCKKIMVLYVNMFKGGKPDKTNWVMHQYHLGTGEDETEGEYVISKIFYQQQQKGKGDKIEEDFIENNDAVTAKVVPDTPKSVIPDPPRTERRCTEIKRDKEFSLMSTGGETCIQHPCVENASDEVEAECEDPNNENEPQAENVSDQMVNENVSDQMVNDNINDVAEESKWWDSESQHLLDSQQLVEGLSLCDELLQSQSPSRDENGNKKVSLSDYAKLGPDNLKRDLEECQDLVLDASNIELDTPPEFRLSQLEFGSQDSFIAWGGGKVI